jgi:hypothetical protein
MIESSGKISNAIAGNYTLSVKAIFREAWDKTNGVKGTFWLALIMIFLIGFCTEIIFVFLIGFSEVFGYHLLAMSFAVADYIIPAITNGILMTSLTYLMIRHISGRTIKSRMIFSFNNMFSKILISSIAVTFLGFVFFFGIILFIAMLLTNPLFNTNIILALVRSFSCFILFMFVMYAFIVYTMMQLLIIEKKINIIPAFLISLRAITKHVCLNIAFYIVWVLSAIIGTLLTLGIGIIWIYPAMINAIAIWYREIFGIESGFAEKK